jgi:hypothetical protein
MLKNLCSKDLHNSRYSNRASVQQKHLGSIERMLAMLMMGRIREGTNIRDVMQRLSTELCDES